MFLVTPRSIAAFVKLSFSYRGASSSAPTPDLHNLSQRKASPPATNRARHSRHPANRNAPSTRHNPCRHLGAQTLSSHATLTPEGSGRASLRSLGWRGAVKAFTKGFTSNSDSVSICPIRANHDMALSIGLGEMRTLHSLECMRSAICSSLMSATGSLANAQN